MALRTWLAPVVGLAVVVGVVPAAVLLTEGGPYVLERLTETVDPGRPRPGGTEEGPTALTFRLRELDSAERRLRTTLDVDFPRRLADRIVSRADGQPVFTLSGLDPRYRDSKLTIAIEDRFNSPEQVLSIPLSQLGDDAATGTPEFSLPVEFELEGSPQRYPFDWYETAAYVLVTLPFEVALDNLLGGRELETTLSVEASSALIGTRIRVGRSHPANPGLDIVVTTSRGSQGVTVLLLLAPLALYLAVAFRLSKEVRARRFSGGPELGIASGLIGLIPVRSALVREGLEVLTMVDYVLAGYVILFLGTAAVEVVLRTQATTNIGSAASASSPAAEGDGR